MQKVLSVISKLNNVTLVLLIVIGIISTLQKPAYAVNGECGMGLVTASGSYTCVAQPSSCNSNVKNKICYVADTSASMGNQGFPVCNGQGGICVACRDNNDCPGSTPYCKQKGTSSSNCEAIGCSNDSQCQNQTRNICNVDTAECVICRGDQDCQSNPSGRHCKNPGETISTCVECNSPGSSQCASGFTCDVTQNRCVAEVTCIAPGQVCGRSAPGALRNLGCCQSASANFLCRPTNNNTSNYTCQNPSGASTSCNCSSPVDCGPNETCDSGAGNRGDCDQINASGDDGLCVSTASETKLYKCVLGSGCSECAPGSTDTACIHNNLGSCSAICQGMQEEIELIKNPPPSPNFPVAMDPAGLINYVATAVGALVVIIAAYQAIMGGYHMLMSEGDPQKIQLGHEELTAAAAGVVMAILGISFLKWVVTTFLGS